MSRSIRVRVRFDVGANALAGIKAELRHFPHRLAVLGDDHCDRLRRRIFSAALVALPSQKDEEGDCKSGDRSADHDSRSR